MGRGLKFLTVAFAGFIVVALGNENATNETHATTTEAGDDMMMNITENASTTADATTSVDAGNTGDDGAIAAALSLAASAHRLLLTPGTQAQAPVARRPGFWAPLRSASPRGSAEPPGSGFFVGESTHAQWLARATA
eukprot:CAMPEP_0170256174 /NCGR_PEP_ID=MMETSP0116_2-20130129/27940_1 /TAXON_ID=400756 /ORGANISM="Durinskia baltica, Strain CSIRO CS-38" /LENGTH=136 /DNA_ID=CAMNT_0010507183 /DNA_START=81 /DNA_END=491 /DNA_ORIENTATION=+